MRNSSVDLNALLRQAVERFNGGDLQASKKLCDQIIAVNPAQPDALNLLAVIARITKQWGKAEQIARFGLAENPQSERLFTTLGLILLDQRRTKEAEQAFMAALELNSTRPEHFSNLGLAQQHMGRWDDALLSYSCALEKAPGFVPALLGRAAILIEKGAFEAAASDFESAGKLAPNTSELHNGKALLALSRGDLEGAYEAFDRAVQVSEHIADAKVNRGLIRMMQGRVQDGWDDYSMRRKRRWGRAVARHAQRPLWCGEDLSSKSILVWCEQGLGEAILCASLIHELEDYAASVTLECDPRLAALFARSFPKSHVVADATQSPADYQAAIFDLIGHLDADCYSRAPRQAYLTCDPIKSAEVKARYLAGTNTRKLVGLSWASPNAEAARQKGMRIEDWEALLRTPGITFVNLQYGSDRGAMAALAKRSGAILIDDPTVDPSGSLDMVADQIAAMDLVIAVSNTTAHIAGGLGKEAWVLVPPLGLGSMWYWFAARTDSPWYQSVSLIRREVGPDGPMMQDMAKHLMNWVRQNS